MKAGWREIGKTTHLPPQRPRLTRALEETFGKVEIRGWRGQQRWRMVTGFLDHAEDLADILILGGISGTRAVVADLSVAQKGLMGGLFRT